jgi:hypothetical protein
VFRFVSQATSNSSTSPAALIVAVWEVVSTLTGGRSVQLIRSPMSCVTGLIPAAVA